MANKIPTAFDPMSQALDAEPCQTSSGLCRTGSNRSVTPSQAEQADDLQGNPRVTTTMLADLPCYETSTILSRLFVLFKPFIRAHSGRDSFCPKCTNISCFGVPIIGEDAEIAETSS